MQRVLRIVLIITFMLLLILWFSTIFNTCNKDKKEAVQSEGIMNGSDSTDLFEDLGDEFFEDSETIENSEDIFNETESNLSENEGTSSSESILTSDDITDYTGEADPEPSSTKPVIQQNAGDNAGYLIVAGSFLLEENAQRMKQKLVRLGYAAEVRNFNFSQYHSVIAGRYNSKSKADQRAGELKAKGIDCLVQKRRN